MPNKVVSQDIDTLLTKSNKEQVASFLGLGGKADASTVTAVSTRVDGHETNLNQLNDGQSINDNGIFSNSTLIAANTAAIATKQDDLTFGILNTNAVKIDNTSAAANSGDICKFAGSGIMPYTFQMLKYDLGIPTVWTTLALKAPIDAPEFTGSIKFSDYTADATEFSSTITSIEPNQNNVPASGAGNDTTTDLAVDQTGNVVRTTQEATWLLTKAQIDGLASGSSGAVTLIQSAGANKFVLVEKATFLINYAYNGGTMNSGQSYNIKQDGNKTDNIAILPATKVLDVVKDGQSSGAGNSDTYGIYEADTGHSILNRSYKPDKAITFSKNNSSTLATAVTSITIKIRYRVYDVASF